MKTHPSTPQRRAARVAALAAPLALTVLAAGPALAAPPEGWSDPEPVSALEALLVWVLIPAAVAGIIVVLAALPRLVGSAKDAPGLTEPAPEQGGLEELMSGSDRTEG